MEFGAHPKENITVRPWIFLAYTMYIYIVTCHIYIYITAFLDYLHSESTSELCFNSARPQSSKVVSWAAGGLESILLMKKSSNIMTHIQPSNDKQYQTQNLKHFTEICEQRTESA